MELRPSEIRFKQDSIKREFQNGKGVNDTALLLCTGSMSPNEFPSISVSKKDNKYYSFDNRRLYVFRVAEYHGAISHIKVRIAPSYRARFDDETFTTTDDGREVKVRYDRTLPHCKPHWLPNYSTRQNSWHSDFSPESLFGNRNVVYHASPVTKPSRPASQRVSELTLILALYAFQ